MDYSTDIWAQYLANRVKAGAITYEKAITSTRTTKEAIDWWLEELNKTV